MRESRYLLQRADGQVLQLSELLHLVVHEVSAERDTAQIAEAVSNAYGRTLTVEGLEHVLTRRLAPLGLVQQIADRTPIRPAEEQQGEAVDPLLSLRLRRTILTEANVRGLARTVSFLFKPAVVVAALVSVITLDVMVFGRGSLTAALNQVLATPTFLLALMGVLTLGALFHELGHAAACHYGGARPGVIGMGVYLVFPAFFTNVTDSYRLDRAGRIRTDLGGLYFNTLCLIILDAGYLLSGNGFLLLAALLMHVEMAQQLIPTVRFDGYFVLADLAGVPDLFSRVGPVLLSLLPGRPTDPRVAELRPAARRLVTVWVFLVVPTLIGGLVWFAYSAPYLISHTVDSVQQQGEQLGRAWGQHDLPSLLLAGLSILLLTIPIVGLTILLQRMLTSLIKIVLRLGQRLIVTKKRPTPAPAQVQPARDQGPVATAPVDKTAISESMERTEGPKMNDSDATMGTTTLATRLAMLPAEGDSQPSETGFGISDQEPVAAKPATDTAEPAEPATDATLPTDGEAPERRPVPTFDRESELSKGETRNTDELSASAFTDAILGSTRGSAPTGGWRRSVFRVSGGAINPGPSAQERREAAVLARVTAPIAGSRRVVVMSRKGGVGKTTTTLALGSMFAMLRGDRVIAVDANPDAGNLAHRVSQPSERTITDVLRCLELIQSYSDLREFTSQSPESRLEVLASNDDPRIGLALNRRAYHRVIQLLDHYYNLILLDTGTGILDSANQGLLSEADQLVLVLRPAVDGARAAALTLDWLSQHGHGELVARAVVVVNGCHEKAGVPYEAIADHFSRRCAKVVAVPWDRALEAGSQTRLSELKPATRAAFVELAASVADHFAVQESF
ncbi:AAA family ATPase [Jatrophihabitans sp. DSM 45814]